ncbi:MAG: hypothetical protein HY313_10210 [Acidobacteria bacterium]|nr:hypothetical protein [Acidobacteriota bacterium]
MRFKKILSSLLLTYLCLPAATATTLLPMNLDDLTKASPVIAYGKIVGSRAEWNEIHTLIYTIYTFQAIEYLKGDLGPSFELHEPGGELDGLSMSVAGVPRFSPGQEAVLFLWTDSRGLHQVTGFEQGNLALQNDPQTGIKVINRVVRLGSASSADSVDSAGSGLPTTSRFLPQLFNQIRSSVAKTREPAVNQ